jgi:hypothetical protein
MQCSPSGNGRECDAAGRTVVYQVNCTRKLKSVIRTDHRIGMAIFQQAAIYQCEEICTYT